jgi:hypothetical protein
VSALFFAYTGAGALCPFRTGCSSADALQPGAFLQRAVNGKTRQHCIKRRHPIAL